MYHACSETLAALALDLPGGAESGCMQDDTKADNIEKFIGSTGYSFCIIGSWNDYEPSSMRELPSNPEQE